MSNDQLDRLLIVDDDASVRLSLSAFMDDSGFDVTAVGSATEGLQVLANHRKDMAIVDLRLPDMGGEALIIEAHRLYSDLQFLVFTGSKAFVLTDELRAAGVEEEQVFYKPVPDMIVLVEAIRRRLAKRGLSYVE